MHRKVVADASAYIRGLAELRGRNVEWAEKAVREAVSLPAEEAVKLHVVDFIATDLSDLLAKVNGKTFELQGAKRTLSTAGAATVRLDPDWRSRLLAVITDPSLAYILMLIGIYGLLFEFYNPGLVLPGVVGAICLLVALYAFQMLPINYAGLALIAAGIAFMVAELFVTSYGALGVGGAVAFLIGSVMLIDTDVPGYEIPWGIIATVLAVQLRLLLFRHRHGGAGAPASGGDRRRAADRRNWRDRRARRRTVVGAGAQRELAGARRGTPAARAARACHRARWPHIDRRAGQPANGRRLNHARS